MRLIPFVAIPGLVMSSPLIAQTAPAAAPPTLAAAAFDQAVAAEAIETLIRQVDEAFVFPQVGKRYAAMLRANLDKGAYAAFASQADFAKRVTADLQAVSKDGHLAVHVVPPNARAGPQSERSDGPPADSAVERAGWIADGIAYIRFDLFPGNPATLADIDAFVAKHRSARALIIDARNHSGGGLAEMDALFPHLFAKEKVLAAMDTREVVASQPGAGADSKFLRTVAGPKGVVRREHYVVPASPDSGLAKADVILLTSKETGSAAEHLAMALRDSGRATLIGETTVGAGHFGGMVPLDKAFTYAAFIPVGRTFNPKTGEGWEGVGVAPHVVVPADQALAEALRRLGVSGDADSMLAKIR